MATQNISPMQRAQLFAMSTRQNMQMIPKQTSTSGLKTLQFSLPKARLLSNIMVRVSGKVNVKHASETTIAPDKFGIHNVIRRFSVDLNNGFSPYVVSGKELAMLNALEMFGDILNVGSATQDYTYLNNGAFTASASGADNDFAFTLQLPITLTKKNPAGLILLQNEQTNVSLNVDIGQGSDMFETVAGVTAEIKEITVNVMCETFSIPASANAYPDLSVLRLVNGRTDSIPTAGQHIVKLSTGTVYRKLLFMVLDEDGKPVDDSAFSGNFELIFNMADVNYAITPEMLRAYNTMQYGYTLPKGMYVFDFSAMTGLPNGDSTRDLIDTERLTEFWLRFTVAGKGHVDLVTDCIARLQ